VAEVLNHEDAGAQQKGVYGAAPRSGVIDVRKVDADKFGPTVDQSVRKILCQIGPWFPIRLRTPARIPTGTDQHRRPIDYVGREFQAGSRFDNINNCDCEREISGVPPASAGSCPNLEAEHHSAFHVLRDVTVRHPQSWVRCIHQDVDDLSSSD
jgi:hypothetical protein